MLGVLVASASLLCACAARKADARHYRERRGIERRTPSFNPAYHADEERRHLAVFFEAADGVLKLFSRPVEIRPGNLMHRSASAGSVLVIYRNGKGKEIGRYATEDPLLIRSCDLDDPRGGVVRLLKRGTVEVLLPFDRAISSLEIGRAEGRMRRYEIGGLVQHVTEATPGD